jgi:hypothetical protein
LKFNYCKCLTGFVGENCEIPICFGKLSNDTTVCFGKGTCIDNNLCSCFDSDIFGHFNGEKNCSKCNLNYFQDSTCKKIECDNILTCNNKGTCNQQNICDCNGNFCTSCSVGWYGSLCKFNISNNLQFSNEGNYVYGEIMVPNILLNTGINCANLLSTLSYQRFGTNPICFIPNFDINLYNSNQKQIFRLYFGRF